mmetsp:Transcript_17245/g.47769  ORF Transcript_17245/g.47769 Transcript_17245/m.47769 type:complete len:121 (-) Transcript_17245:403-765(-)
MSYLCLIRHNMSHRTIRREMWRNEFGFDDGACQDSGSECMRNTQREPSCCCLLHSIPQPTSTRITSSGSFLGYCGCERNQRRHKKKSRQGGDPLWNRTTEEHQRERETEPKQESTETEIA